MRPEPTGTSLTSIGLSISATTAARVLPRSRCSFISAVHHASPGCRPASNTKPGVWNYWSLRLNCLNAKFAINSRERFPLADSIRRATSQPSPSIAGRTATATNTIRCSIQNGPTDSNHTFLVANHSAASPLPTPIRAQPRTPTLPSTKRTERSANCFPARICLSDEQFLIQIRQVTSALPRHRLLDFRTDQNAPGTKYNFRDFYHQSPRLMRI